MRLLTTLFLTSAWTLAQSTPFAALETLYDRDPAVTTPFCAGDFDGNGTVDLLSTSGHLARNDGDGRFTSTLVTSQAIGTATPGLGLSGGVAGDVDGDGDLDVVAPDAALGVAVWRNSGSGGLVRTPGTGIVPAFPPNGFELADVDGDDDLDLIAINWVANYTLELYTNDGTGWFTLQDVGFPTGVNAWGMYVTLDADADGDLDVLLPRNYASPATTLLLNDRTGMFTAAPASPAASVFQVNLIASTDVDGNGTTDIIIAGRTTGEVQLWLDAGGGTWSSTPAVTIPWLRTLLVMDVDADGTDEVVIGTWRSGTHVRDLTPAGVAATGVVLPAAGGATVFARDFDGDGDEDLMTFDGARSALLLNTGSGLAVADGSVAGPRAYDDLDAGDIDGDGDVDLVTYHDSDVIVYDNDGRGNLAWGPATGAIVGGPPPAPAMIEPFDADGDGDLDLFYGNFATAGVLLNQGATWALSTTPVPATGPLYYFGNPALLADAASGDLNGDGRDDVVVARGGQISSGTTVLFGSPGGLSGSTPIAASGVRDIELADIDGDGDLDIMVASDTAAASTGLHLNDGTGVFIPTFPPAGLPVGITASRVASGDLDQNGYVDLLLDDAVYFQNAGGWSPPVPLTPYLPAAASPPDAAIFDSDGDGDLDIVSAAGGLWLNAGGGSFAAPVSATNVTPLTLFDLQLADFDRDGDIDLVEDGPVIHQNLTRQLARRHPVRPGRTASIEMFGEPGATWQLWVSGSGGNLALPQGLVQIDFPTAAPVISGPLGLTTGAAFLSLVVPPGPSLIGATYHTQAVIYESTGPRITTAEVLTVLGY